MTKSSGLGVDAFYFIEPKPTQVWEIANYSLVFLYYPLICLDPWVFSPASAPQWGLQRGD
ncbi:hypothetical protein [Candidatus Uabimicrobium amorphum]|uniref:Uncharacterized protein n=1 Tax=Uabimicrobium amorphum TaxID=2596890 RepID=A0A5S9F4E0_UABAM|nr:hypothetical protein [Candidatus Uabimicrobium amorphum]BBM84489.1 hypothetical protein UABAM_02850 [Candidatus Uabimicrobium amorphum]